MEQHQGDKLSVGASALIWFGAAVSVAEILTGMLFAPLGWRMGLLAVAVGHVIGGVLFYLAGLIGAQTGRSAMETVQLSFGRHGSLLFAAANVVQLVGWTAIMIFAGAQAAAALTAGWGGAQAGWSIIIGVLILLWLRIGMRNFSKINLVSMGTLFLLTLWLSFQVASGEPAAAQQSEAMSFGLAVELAAVMPLSWLPLVSDYTRRAAKARPATLSATLAYFCTSSWMYAIGLAAALFAGQGEIAPMLQYAGLGAAGILVVVLSTVSTTFLDAYSAGVSAHAISARLGEMAVASGVTLLGVLLALLFDVGRFEGFLYFIGSVFAPMIAVQIADYFVLKRAPAAGAADWVSLALWLAGFVFYRLMLEWQPPLGTTLPVIAATFALTVLVRRLLGAAKSDGSTAAEPRGN
ncbi:putative hydroxymethylpyrimidine transporter CytX [Eikenella sp. S3360]|uniref:Hydroxymethylpyrimidine transporter CytX n=1 Tax=Eikenella glucosivorans TaxID=2766967 RepID=A0ABS0NBH9_9NEIS|nr:putative hydroxymethylpyrimidine transporter CytX [Eikenella glucosivorans]MBH5329676.1 putative hydroxymethylpyrimidine transporter CytX [Eikenella glucosivorans]